MAYNVLHPLLHNVATLVIEGPGGSGQGSGILINLKELRLKEGTKVPRAKGPDMELTNDDVFIVTCAHCIPGVRSMDIELFNGIRLKADALVLDNRADVALMKIRNYKWDSKNGYANEHNLRPVKVGKNKDAIPGQEVLAVGSPLMEGYRFSVTFGIISKNPTYNELSILPTLLTDAKINPGNSGGLLALKDTGEWVGMNSSGLFGTGGGNRGLNHALRVEEVLFWIRRMVAYKKVVRDGITSMKFLKLHKVIRKKVRLKDQNGAFIAAIEKDDPGVGKALRWADVVLNIRIYNPGKAGADGKPRLYKEIEVNSPQDCIFAFQHAAGYPVEVDVWRNKAVKTVSFDVPIELMPFSNQASFDSFAMEVQTYRGNKGVQVTNIHPQSPLYGIVDRYSVITGVEDPNNSSRIQKVTSHQTFYQLAEAHGGEPFWVQIANGAGGRSLRLPLFDVRAQAQNAANQPGNIWGDDANVDYNLKRGEYIGNLFLWDS